MLVRHGRFTPQLEVSRRILGSDLMLALVGLAGLAVLFLLAPLAGGSRPVSSLGGDTDSLIFEGSK